MGRHPPGPRLACSRWRRRTDSPHSQPKTLSLLLSATTTAERCRQRRRREEEGVGGGGEECRSDASVAQRRTPFVGSRYKRSSPDHGPLSSILQGPIPRFTPVSCGSIRYPPGHRYLERPRDPSSDPLVAPIGPPTWFPGGARGPSPRPLVSLRRSPHQSLRSQSPAVCPSASRPLILAPSSPFAIVRYVESSRAFLIETTGDLFDRRLTTIRFSGASTRCYAPWIPRL